MQYTEKEGQQPHTADQPTTLALFAQQLGVTALHIKLRATGGNKSKSLGPGGQSALRALARAGMKIGRIGTSQLPHKPRTHAHHPPVFAPQQRMSPPSPLTALVARAVAVDAVCRMRETHTDARHCVRAGSILARTRCRV